MFTSAKRNERFCMVKRYPEKSLRAVFYFTKNHNFYLIIRAFTNKSEMGISLI